MASTNGYANRSNLERYRVELLPNGLVRVFDRATKWSGVWGRDGKPVSGDLARCRPQLIDEVRRG